MAGKDYTKRRIEVGFNNLGVGGHSDTGVTHGATEDEMTLRKQQALAAAAEAAKKAAEAKAAKEKEAAEKSKNGKKKEESREIRVR